MLTTPLGGLLYGGSRIAYAAAGAPQGTAGAVASSAQKYAAAYQSNMAVRQLWTHGNPSSAVPAAVDMWQPLNPSLPGTVAPGTVLQTPMRNVGLGKRLLVEMAGTITTAGGAGDNVAITPWGLSNLVSQVVFTDLANNTRINTTGWHLIAISSAKRRRVWGSAATTDTPFGFGNNYVVNSAPPTIAGSGTVRTFRAFFEVPFTRNDHDLRGAIWSSVSTAQMNLSVTLNPNMFVSNTGDPTLAVYKNASSANLPTLSAVTWQVYQNYLDQGPRDSQGNPVLPLIDIGTAYMLTNTASQTPIANQDNYFPFVNQRQFMSLVIGYDNAGALNAGTDISRIRVASANLTMIRDLDPYVQSLIDRNIVGDDFPTGQYYLDFSDRPIDTSQYGNMVADVVPSLVSGPTAVFLLGWEAYGIIGAVNQGGSINSGG